MEGVRGSGREKEGGRKEKCEGGEWEGGGVEGE